MLFLEHRGIDDPVGAVSVHGLKRALGNDRGRPFRQWRIGAHTHGIDANVAGLFYGNGKQLVAQLIAIGVCIVWAVGTGSLAFVLLRLLLGRNRVPVEVELSGLDVPEMGALGYPEFINHLVPQQIPLSEIVAARRG